jgi:hypothetical protein
MFLPQVEILLAYPQAQIFFEMGAKDQLEYICRSCKDLNPFSFKFTDTRNSSNVLVHTKGSNLYMTDKYIQVDL